MNTLLKRLYWACVGYKTQPWPAPPPKPEPLVEQVCRAPLREKLAISFALAKQGILSVLAEHHNMQPGGMLGGGSEGVPGALSPSSLGAGILGSQRDKKGRGIFDGTRRQDVYLRESCKLAADLLTPHFQSAISATTVAVYGEQGSGDETLIAPERYPALGGSLEEVDVLASAAAWLAKKEGIGEYETGRMFAVAVRDIYHP